MYVIVLHAISVSLSCFAFVFFPSSEDVAHSTRSNYKIVPPGPVCPQEYMCGIMNRLLLFLLGAIAN
jgi:hypothetical protein